MKKRLLHLRRRWCLWNNHPEARWAPIVVCWYEPDRWDGTRIVEGKEHRIKAYRCARHDKVENQ